MRISRRGFSADHGWDERNLKLSGVVWNSGNDAIGFKSLDRVSRFFGPGSHIVTNYLTLSELVEGLKVVAQKSADIGESKIAQEFEGAMAAMRKLENIVANAV